MRGRPQGSSGAAKALAAASLAAAVASGTGCQAGPEVTERRVVVATLRGCPVPQGDAYALFSAQGDFGPDPEMPPVESHLLRETGTVLAALPGDARALAVEISSAATAVTWRGLAEIPAEGDVHVLAWPSAEACRMTRDVERRDGGTLAAIDAYRVLVVGGAAREGQTVPRTYAGDVTTGQLERLAYGLAVRRDRPTVTRYDARGAEPAGPRDALVAGGADPDTGAPLGTAEVYRAAGGDGALGEFAAARVELLTPRAEHGAVELVSGETLLVGGRGPGGLVRALEAVDPRTGRARTEGLALLDVPRLRPKVLRLASGEVLVAGGTTLDGAPVGALEWLAPDGSRATKRTRALVTGREQDFVALATGGALAVVSPDAAPTDVANVWRITPDGALEPALRVPDLGVVRLFPGDGDEPVLYTGSRWLRWKPWFGAFEPLADAPTSGPLEPNATSPDPGLALWLEDRGSGGMNVVGWRFGARSRFATLPRDVLASGTAFLAPDRLPGARGERVRLDPGGGLVLAAGASAFVTDATFAGVAVVLAVEPPSALVVLRESGGHELEVGGLGCPFPRAPAHTVAVSRVGARVRVALDGEADFDCATALDPSARVAVGVRGAVDAPSSRVAGIDLTRR